MNRIVVIFALLLMAVSAQAYISSNDDGKRKVSEKVVSQYKNSGVFISKN